MKKILLMLIFLLVGGCATTKPVILLETESYYLIPANTPFKAIVEDGGQVKDVVRTHDSYVVDAGLLIKLQEEANNCTLNN